MALRQSEIISLAGTYDVPADLALAIYQQESGSGANTVSPTGESIGGFQVSPATFKEVYPEGDINNERDNAIAGIRYLRRGLTATGGDYAQTGMYYHAGPQYAEKLAKNPNLSDKTGKKTISYGQDIVNKASAFQQSLEESGQVDVATGESYPRVTLPTRTGSQMSERSQPLAPPTNREIIENLHSQLLGKLSDSQKQLDTFSTFTNDLKQKYDANIDEVVSAITGEAGAHRTEILANAATNAQLSAEATKRLTDLGINSSDVNNLAAQLSIRMRNSKQQADIIRADIQQKDTETSFLADPITWVQNQLAISDSIKVHNNLIGNFNADQQKITQLTAVADHLTASNLAKKGVLDIAAASAAADRLSFEAKAKAGEVRRLGMQTDFNMAAQQIQIQDAQIRLLESGARILETSENDAEKAKARDMQAQADAISLKQAQGAAAQLGITGINSLADVKRLPPDRRNAVLAVLESGGTRYGKSFLESYANMSVGDRNQLPVGNKTLYPFAFLAYQNGNAKEDEDLKKGIKRTKEEDFKMREESAYADFKSWQENVNINPIANRNENPYRMSSVDVMLKDPDVMKLKIAGLLKTTREQNPSVVIDDKFIVELVKQEFLSGNTYKKIEDAAADLSTYFFRVKEVNNQTHNYLGWSLPEQTGYNFALPGKQRVNWADYNEVIRNLAKEGFWTELAKNLGNVDASSMALTGWMVP